MSDRDRVKGVLAAMTGEAADDDSYAHINGFIDTRMTSQTGGEPNDE